MRQRSTTLRHFSTTPVFRRSSMTSMPLPTTKVIVIDSATILTGSFNFTKAAEEKNAENLLVIKDAPELVKAYEANLQAHAAHAHPYTRQASTAPPAAEADGAVHGNRHSKVYRVPGVSFHDYSKWGRL